MQATAKAVKTNHNTGLLGILAVVFMIIDHVGAIFFPRLTWMRVVGRIAFPLFAWGIAIGAEHTRSIGRYAVRLLLLAVISQPFFMGALNHTLTQLNIFPTLLLGLIGIWGIKDRKEYLTVIALLVAQLISADYGIRGVFCILLLWAVRENPLMLSVCFSAFCYIWGLSSSVVYANGPVFITLQMTAILALPFMLVPTQKRTRTPKWLMYAVYPAHLAVLWAIKVAMG